MAMYPQRLSRMISKTAPSRCVVTRFDRATSLTMSIKSASIAHFIVAIWRVSSEMGTWRPAAQDRGARSRICSSSSSIAVPRGRVDSAPISSISAPCAKIFSPCARLAASPSSQKDEKESGVTFKIPTSFVPLLFAKLCKSVECCDSSATSF